jgi:hypothetical protein
MSYASVAVYIEADSAPEARVQLAAGLADKFGANLIGLSRQRSHRAMTVDQIKDAYGKNVPWAPKGRVIGCPRIAQEIARAFGIDIDKDISSHDVEAFCLHLSSLSSHKMGVKLQAVVALATQDTSIYTCVSFCV